MEKVFYNAKPDRNNWITLGLCLKSNVFRIEDLSYHYIKTPFIVSMMLKEEKKKRSVVEFDPGTFTSEKNILNCLTDCATEKIARFSYKHNIYVLTLDWRCNIFIDKYLIIPATFNEKKRSHTRKFNACLESSIRISLYQQIFFA